MRLGKLLLLLLPVMSMATACGPGSSSQTASKFSFSIEEPSSPQSKKSSSEIPSSKPEEKETSEVYERIWKTKTVHNESCVLLENEDGSISTSLLYTPTKIISVKNYTETLTYNDFEYRIEGKKLIRGEVSSMPYLTKANVSCEERPTGVGYYESPKVPSGKILYTEGTGLIAYQVHVTYEHEDTWSGPIPEKQGNKLPKLYEKLGRKESVNMIIYGDSISTGCNASSLYKIGPNLPTFDKGFASEIERLYGSKVNITNHAVGGTLSKDGLKFIQDNVPPGDTDLVFIGYGMNDGCGAYRVSPDIVYDNIDTMVRIVQHNCPNATVLVCATILANKTSDQDYIQERYLPMMQQIVDDYENTALVDMTSLCKTIREVKNGFELYANNINHPTDFLIRQYVAVMLNAIAK